MTLNGSLTVIFFLGWFALQICALALRFKILEAINQKRPSEDKLDFFSRPANQTGKPGMFSLYRVHYPEGTLIRKYWMANAAELCCFAVAMAFLVFFAK